MAPPCTRGSEANATAPAPSPAPRRTPHRSVRRHRSRRSRRRRAAVPGCRGRRRPPAAPAGHAGAPPGGQRGMRACWNLRWASSGVSCGRGTRSGGGEHQGYVVSAEPERVVDDRHRPGIMLGQRPGLGGHVDGHFLVDVLEVDGGRGGRCSRSAMMAAPTRWRPRRRAGARSSTWWPTTTTPSTAGPSALTRACASTVSPSGVEVACALTCTTCAGSTWPSASARPMAAIRRRRREPGARCDRRRGVTGPGRHAVHRGAARPRVRQRLQDQDPGALAEHEAVPGLVERP